MHSDIGGTGEHQETSVWIDALKRFACGSCHIKSIQIVDLVVTDFPAVYIMIKSLIIILAVCETCKFAAELPDADIIPAFGLLFTAVPIAASGLGKLACHLFCFFKTFFRVEDRRLVHIVPESFDTLVREETIFISEPFPRLRIQYIREMCVTRPYCRYEVASVFPLAEVAVLYTFFVYIIAVLDFYACVDNRNKTDMLIFHLLYESGEIPEIIIYGKILVGIHIIDIHIDHIQRNVILTVALGNLFKIFFCLISPAALAEAEGEFRRDIAVADNLTELLYDLVRGITIDNIQCKVGILAGNFQGIHTCIADIKCQL